MTNVEEKTLEPIGDEPFTDRMYNQFRAKPISAIPSVPKQGYVGTLAKQAPARMLQAALAEAIGVDVGCMSLAYEGKELDLNLTLTQNGVVEPGAVARRKGIRVDLIFVLVGEVLPQSVLDAKTKAEAAEQARQGEIARLVRERIIMEKKKKQKADHEARTKREREENRKTEAADNALATLRHPPRQDGIVQFRCVSGNLEDSFGVCVNTHSSCQSGQLAQCLLDHLHKRNMDSEGVVMTLCRDKYLDLTDGVELLGKQDLQEVGLKNSSIVQFRCTDKAESIDLLTCPQPITMAAFANSQEAALLEKEALVQEVMKDFGRSSGWPRAPPTEEEDELRCLERCQLEGLTYIRNLCKEKHMEALQSQIERASRLGFDELDFVKTLEWVREQAPIIIHVDLTAVGELLAKDTHYRNQFETMSSCGSYHESHRSFVEDILFGKAYDSAKGFDRVKYGTLNFANNPRGVESARHYGKDYFLLKRVRLRTTLTSADSFSLADLGTSDYYAHVLGAYADNEFKAALSMGRHKKAVKEFEDVNRGQYKEAQFHGEVRLKDHVARIVVHESHRSEGQIFLDMLKRLQKTCGDCEALWMDNMVDMNKAAAVPKSLREEKYEDESPSLRRT